MRRPITTQTPPKGRRGLPHGGLSCRLALAFSFALAACAGSGVQAPAPAPAPALAAQAAVDPAPAPASAPVPAPAPEPASPELVFPDEPFRAQQPPAGAVRPFKTPKLERFKLKNGVSVYLIERHTLPIVSMSLVFEGGAATDPKGKQGMAGLCAGLMSEGTEKLEKLAFEEALADIASGVSSGASVDQHYVAMDTLKRNLDPTLDLWADTLLRPGMRKAELDRNIKRRIAGLQQMKGNPESVATRLSGSVPWGPDHLFGRFSTEESVGAIALEDCKTFVADYVKPQNAQLYVVGDITRAELTTKLEARLAGWTGRAKKVARPANPNPRQGRIFFVDIPNAQQSIISLLHLGPQRKAPDYFATSVMSSILGGGFTSRINMNIREKHGYAYGAYGGFRYNRVASTFVAQASVRTDVTKESILEMLKEIRDLRNGDPTDEELVREKQGRILALPAAFSTGSATISAFRDLIYYGLPLNYFDTYVGKVQAVDRAVVKRSAAKYLKPDALQILVVGDGASVLPKLRELATTGALGGKDSPEIVLLDADGKVGRREATSALGARPQSN
jgi:zinc protease